MTPDDELLRRYAEDANQDAFAEFVGRYIDLAYSVAVRVLGGANLLAPDVVQTVFADAARKARRLSRHPAVVGWLHASVRLAALDAMRRDRRRQEREQEAVAMHDNLDLPAPNWERLGPLLDKIMGQLRDRDRDAILLRFFQNKSHREIGAALGMKEEAARKCVDRALENLRGRFTRCGVPVSSALLATAIGAHSVRAAPLGLGATVAGLILSGASPGGAAVAVGLLKFMSINKISATVAGVVALTIVGFGVYEHRQARVAESALAAANQQSSDLQVRLQSLERRVAAQAQPARTTAKLPNPSQSQNAQPAIAQNAPMTPSDPLATLEAVKDQLAHIGNLGHSRNLKSVGIDDATVSTVRAWMAQSPEAALQWLGSLPAEDNQQMHTIEAMIGIEVGSDPELAFELANSISLDSSRLARIGDVLRVWAPLDPAAAAAAVQSADIPESARAILRGRISALGSPAQR